MHGVEFFAPGTPVGQGSKRLMRRRGVPVMLDASPLLKPWRSTIASAAHIAGVRPLQGDLTMSLRFTFPRPANHYGRGGGIRASAAPRPGRVDVDKLIRAVFDALSGVAYTDDRQVYSVTATREWCAADEPGGVHVKISAG